MSRSTIIASVAAVVLGVASYNVLSIDAQWDSKALAAEAGQAPYMDVDGIMGNMVEPVFEELKAAIETAPEKRKDWRSLSMAASSLVEINNLLYIRSEEGVTDKPEWMENVKASHAASVALANSIKETAEYEVIKTNFLAVIQSCNDCHSKVVPEAEVSDIEGPASW